MAFEASCHCGAVALTVEGEIPSEAIECNCSHCRLKGLILAAVPGEALTVTRGADKLETYQFNKRTIDHRFCPTCGAQPFSQGKGQDGSPMAMINLRCVPEADLDGLSIKKFDGASY